MSTAVEAVPRSGAGERRSTAVVLVLCAAAFIAMLDLFVVNVALTTIGRQFHAGLADLSWVLNAYTIAYAVLLIPAGRLSDRYGRRRGFSAGLALFVAASAGCAASGSLPMLVAFRTVQAAGAAALTPASLALLLTVLPLERRAGAVKVWATTSSLAAALGPVLGGALLTASWHWVFLINVPIGVAVLIAARRLVPEVPPGESPPPDLPGAGLLAAGVGALALAIVKGGDWGWTSTATLASFLIAAVGLVLLVRRIATHRNPVVDPALFRVRTFRAANVTAILFCAAFGALFPGAVLWLQAIQGLGPIEVGLAILPGPLMVPLFAAVAERLARRLPTRALVALGNLVFALGAVVLAFGAGADGDYLTMLPGWVLTGIGIGLALPSLIATATASLPAAQAATGSAVVNTSRQLGYVVGVAMLIGVLGTATASAAAPFTRAWVAVAIVAFAAAVTALGMRDA